MKKIIYVIVCFVCIVLSSTALSKDYSCDFGRGGQITGSKFINVDDYSMIMVSCNKKGEIVLDCNILANYVPECEGKANKEVVIGKGDEALDKLVKAGKAYIKERPTPKSCDLGHGQTMESNTMDQGSRVECIDGRLLRYQSDGRPQYLSAEEACQSLSWCKKAAEEEAAQKAEQPAQQPQPEPTAATPAESAQTTPPDAGKILDTKTESGKKTDLSSQSVTGSTKQPTIDGTAAMQNETGKTTSGNVEKSSFVGASNLGDDYGMGNCGSGNIFQQLACRAGIIGSGLKTVGYMIAGFGLIVFSFAAIFGKVKWPLFATIMFSCFLLSATVFVVNMMTDKGDSSWIGGIKGNGGGYYSDNATNVPATDSGGVPDGESPK